MTGFSSVTGDEGGTVWRWDLRSVNAKGLDLRLRLPGGFEALEPKLKSRAQSRLSRGSVSATLVLERGERPRQMVVDPVALRAAVEAVRIAHDEIKLFELSAAKVDPVKLISLPGVMEVRGDDDLADEDQDAVAEAILDGFEAALAALGEARGAEGVRLHRVIAEQVHQIDSLVRDAEASAAESVAQRAEKLRGQVAPLLSGEEHLPPERIAQEVALLAIKADIREELDRLRSHVEAAQGLLAEDGPVGRRLDFLTQEFNREANTLCAKASTTALTTVGLEMKRIVDQIREQVQNVE